MINNIGFPYKSAHVEPHQTINLRSVNQRVVGSSPTGGAKKKKGFRLFKFGALFLLKNIFQL